MASVHTLITACQAAPEALAEQAQQRLSLWDNWLRPVQADNPTGADPGYDDDFQQMREEVNKLSGADTDLICTLAEKLLTTTSKDIRVATYYAWARLHRDGEAGLADGLDLLAGLMQRFNTLLHPQRERSRQGALEWLASTRMLDSLSLYPEANNTDTLRIAGALWLTEQVAEGAIPGALHQALLKSGREHEAAIIQADLKGLLSRLTGLETLAFNDGTPFADEVTLNWIQQQVMDSGGGWQEDSAVTAATVSGDNDILQLESEALTLADSNGPDVALSWLQNRPGITTARSRWLLRLLMARVAEQTGKNELALHLLGELDGCAAAITLTQWEPDLLFEVKARRLKLLRMKAGRNDTDKTRLNPEMEHLLAGLIAIDPARAAVLCA